MSHRLAKPWLAGVAVLVVGCAGEPEVDPCSHRLCNIDELECVEQVAVTVACKLGEAETIVPAVRFVTVAELVAEIEAETEPLTPEQIDDVTDYYLGEALVGLMPATYEYTPPQLNVTEWVAAFYSLEDDEIVVITDNFDSDDPESAYLVLVHEMVHAYQDQGRDLEALSETYATSFDRFLGLRAAIEGEAMYHQSLTELELAGLHPGRVDWGVYYEGFREYVLAAATESEVPSQDAVSLFPYPYGSQFIYESDHADGFDGIDAVFETPPDSVRQVMGGYDAWPTLLQNRDDLLDPHALPVLPDRYTYLGGGHQSVWLLNTMLQRTAGYAGSWASAQLQDVSADYLSIHRDEESGELVAVWRIQSDEPNYLLTALDPTGSSWRPADANASHPHVFTTIDGDVVLVATTGDDALPVLAEIAGWQSLGALQVEPAVTRMRRSQREILAAPIRPGPG